ncbi:uncharacterized protein PGTG_20696 [Puccinia graminis f. sp. tritici CRL 75-36-700-3]|uniref:Uncharacterized protein n=1 Tax=Puccinia graminis f. sp. tritici (strain CRL 75-36-700-3 / race SCCL) TaxID=418459 RepID=H6QPF1_PUCGT|nr:uncharacterized protein PGTG_20696 [Puccinia graminis f. sp. tritici CRL 75-36-700-3]EHS63602.1 hypothetical protein PGTG_20696 [Puccinia graminis f. sp. tritici CRL 75-36-700-3]
MPIPWADQPTNTGRLVWLKALVEWFESRRPKTRSRTVDQCPANNNFSRGGLQSDLVSSSWQIFRQGISHFTEPSAFCRHVSFLSNFCQPSSDACELIENSRP